MTQNKFTVTGIVFNENGQILMIKHKKQGKWLPPGGHLEENELPHEALKREILEETGVAAEVLSTTPKLDLSDGVVTELPLPLRINHVNNEDRGTHNYIDMLYLCRAISADTAPQEAEINGIGWFRPDEAVKLDTYENVIVTIKALGGRRNDG